MAVTCDILFLYEDGFKFMIRIPLTGEASNIFQDYLKSINLVAPDYVWFYSEPMIHKVNRKILDSILLLAKKLNLEFVPPNTCNNYC